MIRKFIKKWFGLYDIDDLIAGAHCGCCGKYLPKEITPKSNSWSLCPNNCSENSDSPKSKDSSIMLTSLLIELKVITEQIEATISPLPLAEVWSKLQSIRLRYKVPQ